MMLEEGLAPIDEQERLRLQAKVDSARQQERRVHARRATHQERTGVRSSRPSVPTHS
ncbi:hypothetical protein [Austwickia chelonae]|uniref:hypothetical protein n=1 Tax=Austwickia chelonae TaxID=100225 RepID=UPI0012DDA8EF|nr:hypothetical protein [Austwickia chelonae]